MSYVNTYQWHGVARGEPWTLAYHSCAPQRTAFEKQERMLCYMKQLANAMQLIRDCFSFASVWSVRGEGATTEVLYAKVPASPVIRRWMLATVETYATSFFQHHMRVVKARPLQPSADPFAGGVNHAHWMRAPNYFIVKGFEAEIRDNDGAFMRKAAFFVVVPVVAGFPKSKAGFMQQTLEVVEQLIPGTDSFEHNTGPGRIILLNTVAWINYAPKGHATIDNLPLVIVAAVPSIRHHMYKEFRDVITYLWNDVRAELKEA